MNYLTVKSRLRQRREQRAELAPGLINELTNEEKKIVLNYGVLIILSDLQAGCEVCLDNISLKRRFQDFLAKRLSKEPPP